LRFCPLQRVPGTEQRHTGPNLPRRGPPAPTGFPNLLTRSSAPNLPAIFRPVPLLGLRPPELCSSHAAVRRLRRQSPPAVRSPLSITTHGQRVPSLSPRKQAPAQTPPGEEPSEPSTSGHYSTRESATSRRRFRPPRARSSPGLSHPPGVCPSERLAQPADCTSPHAVRSTAARRHVDPLPQGLAPPRDGDAQAHHGPSWVFPTS
jgi:hypothetical protein